MKYKPFVLLFIVGFLIISPIIAAEDANQTANAWYWYNKAVDLANAGQFADALQANEKALSINQSMPVAWANQAGILVQLGRYDEAITAADIVLSSNSTDLPNTYAAAYYSKGDALRALGKTDEARAAYARAADLDPTLVAPVLPQGTVSMTGSPITSGVPTSVMTVSGLPATSSTRSPVPYPLVFTALMLAIACRGYFHKNKN
jgi:tetratricopeptide (TPR) repeat protein